MLGFLLCFWFTRTIKNVSQSQSADGIVLLRVDWKTHIFRHLNAVRFIIINSFLLDFVQCQESSDVDQLADSQALAQFLRSYAYNFVQALGLML